MMVDFSIIMEENTFKIYVHSTLCLQLTEVLTDNKFTVSIINMAAPFDV